MKILIVKAEGLNSDINSFHFFDKGKYVDLTAEREKAESLNNEINKFVLKAKKEYESLSFLSLYRLGSKFLLNIPVQEKDSMGRTTSIVFLFKLERNSSEEINKILDNLQEYSKKCKRTIAKETIDEISKILNSLILKKRGKRLDLGTSFAVTVLSGTVSYFIMNKKFLSIILSIGAGAICYGILKVLKNKK